jgi:uncharacterized protein (TIGR02647 family)
MVSLLSARSAEKFSLISKFGMSVFRVERDAHASRFTIRIGLSLHPPIAAMSYTPELVHELNTLIRFDPDTGQQGIKVHKNADENVKAAVRRLYAKGLITQADGGYLTRLGREAAGHARVLLGMLTAGLAASVTAPPPPGS